MEPLYKVDTHLLQDIQNFLVLNILGHGFFTQRLNHLDNGAHQGLINGIAVQVLNKLTIQFDVIRRQVFQISKTTEA